MTNKALLNAWIHYFVDKITINLCDEHNTQRAL